MDFETPAPLPSTSWASLTPSECASVFQLVPVKSSISWRGLDTETTIQDGMGQAILVTTDDDALAFPGDAVTVFGWLHDKGDTHYAAFNADYDCRAILSYLPKRSLRMLYHDTRLEWRGYELHYIPRKVLEVRRGDKLFSIYDVHQFYGGTLKANAHRVGREKHEIPTSWLWRMDWALQKHTFPVVAYAIDDAEIAKLLMEKLYVGLNKFVDCSKPYSPASIARSYYGSRIKFGEHRGTQILFQSAYRGGRIEVFKRGNCGAGTRLDIVSAYPHALSLALDPRKMTLARTNKFREDAFYGAYDITVEIPEKYSISPLAYWHEPEPSKRLCVYPCGKFRLVVDRESLKLVQKLSLAHTIHEAWEYLVDTEEKLFPEIHELFRMRKGEPDLNLAIKLVLNGLYGVLCQEIDIYVKSKFVTEKSKRVGNEWRNSSSRIGAQTHYAVGGFATGYVRSRVFDMAQRDPSNVLFIATDAVAFRGPGPQVQTGSDLGEWSRDTNFEDSIIVGSGIYSLKSDGKWKDKMRGLRLATPLARMLDTSKHTWSVSVTSVDTLGDTVREANTEFNVIRKVRRTIDINFDSKRCWPAALKSGRELLNGYQDSEPWIVEG
jgi:DNA polymerase type B, organellar and viral